MEARCPICWLPVVDDVWTCPGCATPQHARCVESGGGCVVAGCAGRGKPSFKPPVAPAPVPEADVDPDAAAAEATAASMARIADSAREARAARTQAAQAGASQDELSGTPFGSEDTGAEARRVPQVLARPGALPAEPASPESAVVGDPRRGWFGRLLDSAAEAVAVLPSLLPLLVFTVACALIPTAMYTWGGIAFFTSRIGIFLQYAAAFVPPALLVPAVALLVLDPARRRLSHGDLLGRVVGTWPRFLPTAAALVAAVWGLSLGAALLAIPLMKFNWSSFIGAIVGACLVWGAIYGAFCLTVVVACTSRAEDPHNSMARGLSLAWQNPLSALGAVMASLTIPALALMMIQMNLPRSLIGGSMVPLVIVMSALSALIRVVWPVVYLTMLYRDLTAAERA